jgi:hypothetical protein
VLQAGLAGSILLLRQRAAVAHGANMRARPMDGRSIVVDGTTPPPRDLPTQQLIGFTRVDLEPGASKTVSFVVPLSVLAYTGLANELVMEPRPVEFSAGSSSDDLRSKATLTVTGKTRTIRGEERKFLSVATVGQ